MPQMRKLERILSMLVIAAALVSCVWALQTSWETFLTKCPNKDVLHWDGNLRTALVLDRYQQVRDGNLGEVVRSHLRANTWPPLRPLISLALFLVTDPDLVTDVGISFVFFALTFAAVLVASLRMSATLFAGACSFAAVVGVLLHTKELNAYALASMLETQGMFFLVLSVLFLFLLYERARALEARSAAVDAAPRQIPANRPFSPLSVRALWWGLFLSVQGLVFTKYPYAIILFVSVILFEFIREPLRWLRIGHELLATHYRGVRRVLILAFVGIVIGLLIAGRIGYLGVNTRVTKRLIYIVCVVIFIDFNAYAFFSRERARVLFPESIRLFYLAGVLPALTWIFINPDRFSTVLGGQFWVGTAKLRGTLFETLGYLFQPAWPALVLLGLGILGMKYFFLRRQSTPLSAAGLSARWAECVRRPEVAALLICWLMYIAQDLFNPNKQDRHVYHIVPMLLLCSLVSFQSAMGDFGPGRGVLWRPGGGVLVLLLGCVPLLGAGGLLTGGYTGVRYFCYTDVERDIFAEARWTAAQLHPGKKYIVINYFHFIPLTVGKRNQASEMDVLLRMRAIETGGRVFSDHRFHRRDWSNFDFLLVVSPDCGARAVREQVAKRAAETGTTLRMSTRSVRSGGGVCTEQWPL